MPRETSSGGHSLLSFAKKIGHCFSSSSSLSPSGPSARPSSQWHEPPLGTRSRQQDTRTSVGSDRTARVPPHASGFMTARSLARKPSSEGVQSHSAVASTGPVNSQTSGPDTSRPQGLASAAGSSAPPVLTLDFAADGLTNGTGSEGPTTEGSKTEDPSSDRRSSLAVPNFHRPGTPPPPSVQDTSSAVFTTGPTHHPEPTTNHAGHGHEHGGD